MLNATNIKDFVDAYLAESDRRAKAAAGPTAIGMTATHLGRHVSKDPSAVFDLRAGVEFRAKKIAAWGAAIEALMPGFTESYFAKHNVPARASAPPRQRKAVGDRP